MKGYVLTRRANEDLNGIAAFTQARWDLAQAKIYIAKINAHLDAIVQTPGANRHRSMRVQPFKMVRAESHYIIYDIHNDWIVVVAVPHTRQDVEGMAAHLSAGYRRDLDELKARFPALQADGTIGEV